ncbi:hypothetical protein [Nakamurella sp.]|uniref:hypothetical protein n=1 Tax=Nakamurella sp. TaxID=1869182 RepID=UPI003783D0B7
MTASISGLISGPVRLEELDLTMDVVAAALAAADRESAHCSELDPPILEGLLRWGRATRALREQLVPQGWTYDNPNNLARTIHPSGDFAVVLATGDEGTGLPSTGAGPRHTRGYATEQAIHANGQLAFEFGSLLHLAAAGRSAGLGHLQTWFLLYHPEPEHFRAELSLPRGIDRGRITRWTERILLPPLPRGAPVAAPVVRLAEARS